MWKKELNETYIGNARRYESDLQILLQIWFQTVRWASAVPENMQKKWRKNFAEEGFRRQQFTATQTVQFSMDRSEAIEKLESGEIRVIFSVDMFNEGVDIPSVDMVMFLRPTESPVVFLQQLRERTEKK